MPGQKYRKRIRTSLLFNLQNTEETISYLTISIGDEYKTYIEDIFDFLDMPGEATSRFDELKYRLFYDYPLGTRKRIRKSSLQVRALVG